MPILPILNLKGGVAKTVTTVAIAECFAAHGHRVLIVDADHQCMAGELVLGEKRQLQCEGQRKTFYDLLVRMLDDEFEPESFPKFVTPNVSNIAGGLEKLSVLPCSIRIDDIQTNVAKAKQGFKTNDEFQRLWGRRREQMKSWLNRNYDFVLIDCPPSLAPQVRFILTIADSFIVPTVPDRLSVRGSLYLLSRLATLGYRVEGLGTLWSLYREQNNMHKAIVAASAKGDSRLAGLPKPFETIIPNATKIAEATDATSTNPASFPMKYTYPFAKLFESVCEEIAKRAEWTPPVKDVKRAVNAGR